MSGVWRPHTTRSWHPYLDMNGPHIERWFQQGRLNQGSLNKTMTSLEHGRGIDPDLDAFLTRSAGVRRVPRLDDDGGTGDE